LIHDFPDARAGKALERCVGDVDSFLKDYWAAAPLYRGANGVGGFEDLLTLADVDAILTERGLRFPAIRLVKDGQTLTPSSYTKSIRLQSREVDDFVDPGRVLQHFSDGATIVLQALHRYWEPLSHFCRELELALTHPVQVNVYLTPPHARGLSVHYDTHDVFVLQVSGTKLWKVWGSATALPLAHQRRTDEFLDPGASAIEVELTPGDCLYIPRGFLHAAETAASESTHMTVGILTYRWMDVMKSVMERAGDELFMREALPPGFGHAPEKLESEVADRLTRLVEWVGTLDPRATARSFADKFWAGRTPVLTGQLHQILALESLSDESLVRKRRGATCRVKIEDEGMIVVLGDRRLHMPRRLSSAIYQILESPEFKVAELDEHLDAEGRLVLVRRLIKEGLLEHAFGD
jgi:lysine-specific demethylase/histidyl-hydroxylase NO66